MDTQEARSKRPTVQGKVISSKMQDTIVVQEDRQVLHPLYKKYIKRSTKYVAHDSENACIEGDVVEIAFTRPISKTKRWRLIRVLRAAARDSAGDAADRAAAQEAQQ